jgi:phosphatidate cytidylyltransferase
MLKQRVITAVFMLCILVPAIFYPSSNIFAGLAVGIIASAAWEWARLNGYSNGVSVLAGVVCAALCVFSWQSGILLAQVPVLWIGAGAAWVLFGVWVLVGGVPAWLAVPQVARLVIGVIALWVAWVAVAKARSIGIEFLFSVLVLVWVADIAAYFSGKAFGGKVFKRKLAPTISPGKTWEGALGGVFGVLLVAFVWGTRGYSVPGAANNLYARLGEMGSAFLLVSVLFLSAMSVVGDLVESLVKRGAGAKDSSNLLPGHGGVLDRIDALLPVLPLALMLITI